MRTFVGLVSRVQPHLYHFDMSFLTNAGSLSSLMVTRPLSSAMVQEGVSSPPSNTLSGPARSASGETRKRTWISRTHVWLVQRLSEAIHEGTLTMFAGHSLDDEAQMAVLRCSGSSSLSRS